MDSEAHSSGWECSRDLMGYKGKQYRMPLTDTGFRDDRNVELLPPTALLYPSANVNYHENGLSKRGGTEIMISGRGLPGQGLFQFYTPTIQKVVFAANGVVYQTNYSNPIASGFSISNPVDFVQTAKYVFMADGQSIPHYWDGLAPTASAVTPASSWTGNMPFQMVIHTRAGSGSGDRLWAVTSDSVWGSKLGDPTMFDDDDVIQIPIDSIGGLIGAFDLGGQLFAFSRTQTFLIADTDPDISNWGYTNAIWEGGVASYRLIKKGNNNIYLMTEDGLIYDLIGVLTTGGYNATALNRPAFVDKYIRDNVNLGSIQNFHAAYDRKLRAIKFFMQSGGNGNNIALTYFIDKQPTSAWIIHNNTASNSGYNATCSAEVRVTPGNYQVWTMDSSGNVWALEQTSRDDNGQPYPICIATKAQDLEDPRSVKHYMAICLRGQASGTVNFTMYPFVEGQALGPQTFQLNGTGATFDSATFDNSFFSTDLVTSAPVYIGVYGRDLQIQLFETETGVDFFLAEILYLVKPLGIKVAA